MSKTPRNRYGDKPGHFPAVSQRMRYAPLRPSCAKGSVDSCLLKGQALYERRAREHQPFREPFEPDSHARLLDKRAVEIDAPNMDITGDWKHAKPRVQARLDHKAKRIGLLKLGRPLEPHVMVQVKRPASVPKKPLNKGVTGIDVKPHVRSVCETSFLIDADEAKKLTEARVNMKRMLGR